LGWNDWATVWWKNYDDMLSRFHTIPACHGRTDRRTDRIGISISRVSSRMLTRDKKLRYCAICHFVAAKYVFLLAQQDSAAKARRPLFFPVENSAYKLAHSRRTQVFFIKKLSLSSNST